MSVEAGQETGGKVGREAGHRLGFAGGVGRAPQLGPEHPGITLGARRKQPPPKASTVSAQAPGNPPLRDTWEKEDEWLPPDTFLVSQPECFLKKVANPCFTKVSWWPGMNGSQTQIHSRPPRSWAMRSKTLGKHSRTLAAGLLRASDLLMEVAVHRGTGALCGAGRPQRVSPAQEEAGLYASVHTTSPPRRYQVPLQLPHPTCPVGPALISLPPPSLTIRGYGAMPVDTHSEYLTPNRMKSVDHLCTFWSESLF